MLWLLAAYWMSSRRGLVGQNSLRSQYSLHALNMKSRRVYGLIRLLRITDSPRLRRRVPSSRRLLVRVSRGHKVGGDGKHEESMPVHYVRSFDGHTVARGIPF